MCGIVGYAGKDTAGPILVEGLHRLEYRGYDSAGVAIVSPRGQLQITKTQGNVDRLAARLRGDQEGTVGIGHTRWATHGKPSEANAHPHIDAAATVAVVHNGIVENAAQLRRDLRAQGVTLVSDTDSEVLAHLIAAEDPGDPLGALRQALGAVRGTYALAVLHTAAPHSVVVARRGSPVVLGRGARGYLVASDLAALEPWATEVLDLEDDEVATVGPQGASVLDAQGRAVTRPWQRLVAVGDRRTLEGFAHYMEKEIHEQPRAIADTVAELGGAPEVFEQRAMTGAQLAQVRRVTLLGCGSAFYAALSGAQMIERLAGIPAVAESAAEFRYRQGVVEPGTLSVVLSQSGETLDTLEAARLARQRGAPVLGVVNTEGSSIDRVCDARLLLHAGAEVSVAATKSSTAMMSALALLALSLGRAKGLDASVAAEVLEALGRLPAAVGAVLEGRPEVARIARGMARAHSAFYVGRIQGYPVALEGALKMKEVSYLHAEAYPAAELKHGPLALVTASLPTVAVVPDDALFAKNLSTIEEIQARGGPVIAMGHSPELKALADEVLLVPPVHPLLDPIVLSVPLQLLAYQVAVARGVDVDRPRNLAKSVTVE